MFVTAVHSEKFNKFVVTNKGTEEKPKTYDNTTAQNGPVLGTGCGNFLVRFWLQVKKE